MDGNAWISTLSAGVSFLSLVANVIFSSRSTRTASGAVETTLLAQIRSTKQSVRELALRLADVMDGRRPDELKAPEKRKVEVIASAFAAAVEDNLNAYEDACAKYIDKKVDKSRFKKTYTKEIGDLCTSQADEIRERLHPADISEFRCIWRVYREWYDIEKS